MYVAYSHDTLRVLLGMTMILNTVLSPVIRHRRNIFSFRSHITT